MLRAIDRLVLLCTAAGVAATGVSLASADYFLSDLFANLRLHLAAGGLLLGLYAIGRRLWTPAVVLLVGCAVNAWPAYAVRTSASMPAAAQGEALRVLTVNVSRRNDHYRAVVEHILSQAADVVVLQEVTPRWASELAMLEETYPFFVVEPRDDSYGVAMLSKREPRAHAVRFFAAGGIPYTLMRFEVGDDPVVILGVHLSWPVAPRSFRQRNAQLNELIEMGSESGALVVCGDLNLSNWSRWFARLRTEGGFAGASTDVAPATWPSPMPWAGISIDHCVSQAPVAITGREVGPAVGSDHRPVLFELRRHDATGSQ